MRDQKGSQLVKGALLLTLAGLISKVMSAGYRIPLQNITGDVGFYIYQQVYPILGMAMMLALYGFPQAISKIIVELEKQGKALSNSSFYAPIFAILFIINGIFFILLSFNGHHLARWIGDANLATAYQFASIIFLCIPFTSLLRGVFQGNLYMKPTAYSQISEQFMRVSLIIIAAILVSKQILELYDIGKAAVFASLIGSITAIFVLFVFFMKERPITKNAEPIPWKFYVKTMIGFGVIATFNHMILLVIQLADSFSMVSGLIKFGMTKLEAMEFKGVFDRGQPLIQLGTVLGSSFALALIPTISKDKLQKNKNEYYFYIRSGLLFSFYLAFAATIGLIAIFPEVNMLLFKDDKGTLGLQILVLSIFFSSIIITITAILQSLGMIKRTAMFIIIIFFVKLMLNYFLLPLLGIIGSALATVISLFLLFIIVSIELKRKIPNLHMFKSIHWKSLFLASMAMLIYLIIMNQLIPYSFLLSRIQLLGYVLFIVATGACIFLFVLLKGKAFTERQLELLPYASFFIKISKGGKD